MKKLAAFLILLLGWSQIAYAQTWDAGQQTITYSAAHILGDNSDSKGGLAPYYSLYEPNDTPTSAGIISQWKIACLASDLGTSCGQYVQGASFTGSTSGTTLTVSNVLGTIEIGTVLFGAGVPGSITIASGSGTTWTLSSSAGTIGAETMTTGGHEGKARFDCNISFHEKSDPILGPGTANFGHDHSFFGALGFQGHAYDITYSGLRGAGGGGSGPAGYSTCYGGPMNRTLYWEPSMEVPINGVTAVLQPYTIVTYYICGDNIIYTGSGSKYGPPNCSRWPRSFNEIFGFSTSDPTDSWGHAAVTIASAAYGGANYSYIAPTGGWYCSSPATPSYTAYSAVQVQGATQPYFNDGAGHLTLLCNPTLMDGGTACTLGAANCGYVVLGDIVSPDCWDGHNHSSPNGRKHLIQRIQDNNLGTSVCPDNWYIIPHFEAKPTFLFTSQTQMANAYLSSDRMPGMTQYAGGQTLHADLLPAWDYGTGDAPGFMLRFFQHCLGLTMHVKNADGVTFTDLTGDPHECGFGRIDSVTNSVNTGAPPDSLGPNPVVTLTSDQTGAKAYFPLPAGTALPGTVLHQAH